MNGKFRADYQETSGGEACDNAFDDAVTGGFGCFRMCADYEDEMDPSNEQRRISLLPVYDPATCVFFDQDSKQYDRSDAMWAMEMFSMTPKAFETEYPDSIAASLSRDDTGTQYDWSTPDAIYVGRYYEVRIEKVKLTAWRNPVSGETAIYDEEQIKDIVDELTDGAFELIGERTVKKRRVYCGLLSGAEWLEEPKRIPGEHIPLIPVYGRRSFVDNQERIEGHAAKAMDAQRLENLMVSMIADNATQAGGDGIPVVDVDMIPGPLAAHWAERNKKRPAFLPMVSLKTKTEILLRRLRSAVIRLRHKCLQLLPGYCSTPERLFSKLQVRRSLRTCRATSLPIPLIASLTGWTRSPISTWTTWLNPCAVLASCGFLWLVKSMAVIRRCVSLMRTAAMTWR